MAKKDSEAEFSPKAENAAPALPKIGDSVLYHKSLMTQQGTRFETFPAICTGFPKQTNFQAKDLAINIVIFGQPGSPFDARQDVMFSAEPLAGRWSTRG